MKKLFVIVLTLLLGTAVASANIDVYPFKSVQQQQQFQQLTTELRCLVCQNQNLADSNAPLAQDLRQDIYKMVVMGKSNEEIVNYLVVRYGAFIRFKPALNVETYLLWFGPFLFLLLGLLMLRFYIKKRPKS